MLCLLLQPKTALGNDYRLLAAKMGYTNDYIKYLGSTNEPVKELITEYEKGDRKIVELESLLKEIERYAVVEDLQKYIGRLCFCIHSLFNLVDCCYKHTFAVTCL